MSQDIKVNGNSAWNSTHAPGQEKVKNNGKGNNAGGAGKPREDSVTITGGAGNPAVNGPGKTQNTPAIQKAQEALGKIEDLYESQIDAIKNSDSYKQAMQDLAAGKGVQTNANGEYIYYGQGEDGLPNYAIFEGQIYLEAESGGYWAVTGKHGKIDEGVEVKKPQEGEEGYGASELSSQTTIGKDLKDFLQAQSKASDTWKDMLKGVGFGVFNNMGAGGANGPGGVGGLFGASGRQNMNFSFLSYYLRTSQSSFSAQSSQNGGSFKASYQSYSRVSEYYYTHAQTKVEKDNEA